MYKLFIIWINDGRKKKGDFLNETPCIRCREELEKQQAKERYEKLHLAGKTDEARADLARLALIRKQREEAAKKREDERKGMYAVRSCKQEIWAKLTRRAKAYSISSSVVIVSKIAYHLDSAHRDHNTHQP